MKISYNAVNVRRQSRAYGILQFTIRPAFGIINIKYAED